jgi:hypothetical protein
MRFGIGTPRAQAFKWPELAAATPRAVASKLTSLFGAQRVHPDIGAPDPSDSPACEKLPQLSEAAEHETLGLSVSGEETLQQAAPQPTGPAWRMAPGRSPRKRVSIQLDPVVIFQGDVAAAMNQPLPPIRNVEDSEIERAYHRGWFRSILAILLN